MKYTNSTSCSLQTIDQIQTKKFIHEKYDASYIMCKKNKPRYVLRM
jgi:hypothetical protein